MEQLFPASNITKYYHIDTHEDIQLSNSITIIYFFISNSKYQTDDLAKCYSTMKIFFCNGYHKNKPTNQNINE